MAYKGDDMFKKIEKRITDRVRVDIASIQDKLKIPYGETKATVGFYSYFQREEISLKDSVQLILDHLGLEIKQVDEVPSKTILTKKKSKKRVAK